MPWIIPTKLYLRLETLEPRALKNKYPTPLTYPLSEAHPFSKAQGFHRKRPNCIFMEFANNDS